MSKTDPNAPEGADTATETASAADAAALQGSAAADLVEPAQNGAGLASYRVLRKGEGKVFTGEHGFNENGQPVALTFPPGAIVHGAPLRTALELEDRGFVEVVDG